MNSHILVCPADANLIKRLQGRTLVVRANDPENIPEVMQYSRIFQIHIHCLWMNTEMPMTSVLFQELWQDIPLAWYASCLGRFRDLAKQLLVLRKLNIRVYLPTTNQENYAAIRILSSLGINAALVLNERGQDWETISDLMTYALLGLVPHAPIEPFHYIASHYDLSQRTDFSSVYFNDPLRYLHLDEQGRVGVSQEALIAGDFVAQDINTLDEPEQCHDYIQQLEDWRSFFLKPEGCAYCQGWRVCLGKYEAFKEKNPGCVDFFVELMDTVEQYRSQNHDRMKDIWQP